MPEDILIIDDEKDICDLIADVLKDEGYSTRAAYNSMQALEAVSARVPSIVVTDIWLEGSEMDGMELLSALRSGHPNMPVIMISGHGSISVAVDALKQGAYDFIEKPFKEDRLLSIVRRASEHARLKQENAELRTRGVTEATLLGKSPAVQQIRQCISRVAPAASRILITGAPGTGKEVVARAIHAESPRAGAPFLVLNAATLSPERVEEALFGNERTMYAQIGAFERAHQGTLLLDEVADMPLETQGKILRMLQEQTFTRVGGSRPVAVDVRVMAATSRDLEPLMADGRFRRDLFYRLNVVPIHLPRLAERRADIPEFCDYFLERAAVQAGLAARTLAENALTALQAYAWPGNVRELRNMMERLLIMAPGNTDEPITLDMLPPEVTSTGEAGDGRAFSAELLSMPLKKAREAFEKEYLVAQITRFEGNVSRASQYIGMERSALHRKLKTLGV